MATEAAPPPRSFLVWPSRETHEAILKQLGESSARNTPQCTRCGSYRIIADREYVCSECGLVQGTIYPDSDPLDYYHTKTYRRIFYFNERMTRWMCTEPEIEPHAWALILAESKKERWQPLTQFQHKHGRSLVSALLKSLDIPEWYQERYRSRKFRCNPMTAKRFYDKYNEKWKTICWRLSGIAPVFPSPQLVRHIRDMFLACQRPFELYRHAAECDGRNHCDRYFDCLHNLISYDFLIRKLLQACELKFGFRGVYEKYKWEFRISSAHVRDKKLRPLVLKIFQYNNWPCIASE